MDTATILKASQGGSLQILSSVLRADGLLEDGFEEMPCSKMGRFLLKLPFGTSEDDFHGWLLPVLASHPESFQGLGRESVTGGPADPIGHEVRQVLAGVLSGPGGNGGYIKGSPGSSLMVADGPSDLLAAWGEGFADWLGDTLDPVMALVTLNLKSHLAQRTGHVLLIDGLGRCGPAK